MTPMVNPGRFAGLLYVLTSIVGFFAMGYVPGKLIVHGNTVATVNNIAAHEILFRFGIAGQLISQAAFIFVAFALYKLLVGVDRRHASLMVILIVVSVPIAFVNELNSLAALALVLVRGADFLSRVEKPQRDAFAMLFLNLHGRGLVVAELFWGLWLFPLGLLVYRSRFLPRFFGRLARPCRGRLGHPETCERSAPAISERGLHVHTTRCLRRDCIHVGAVD
jgi:hypothetical protein